MPHDFLRFALTVLSLTLALPLGGCDDDPPPIEDAGADAGVGDDAGSDAGTDAGSDAGSDAGVDAGTPCTPECGECEECVGGTCESIGAPHPIARITSGWYHILAIDASNVLYVWGENDNGQLGLGDNIDRDVATRVPGNWIAADGGSRHSCAVRDDGTLWCMGANVHGQLGTGDTMDRNAVSQVAANAARDMGNPWIDVAVGGLHTCALKQDLSVWCFGSAAAGQLGLGTPSGDVHEPMRVGGASPLRWSALSAMTRHTCAILESDSTLHCWGDNSDGQIGQGETDRDDRHTPQPVVGTSGASFDSLRCGARHTCAIDDTGALVCFGANDFGYLGVGDTMDRGAPVGVGTGWAEVDGGFEHTCAITTTGEIHCWGGGMFDQLGLGSTEMQTTPQRVGTGTEWAHVTAGYYHTCATTSDGTTYCWGDNNRGQQGGGSEIGARRPEPGRVCFGAP